MNLQEISLVIENKKVNYLETGNKEKPTIVCFHGVVGSSMYSFKKLFESLSDKFHLIAIDQPGHGKSSSFESQDDYLFSSLSKWYGRVIPYITEKEYYVLGHSWGADVALHITKYHPKNVLGVILLDGGFTFPEFQEEATFTRIYNGWSYYMDHSTFQSWDDVLKGFEQYTKQPIHNFAEEIQSILSLQREKYELIVPKSTVLSIIKAFYDEPFKATYPLIKSPLLLLHATQPVNQQSARIKGIREIQKHVRAASIVSVKDSGHMIQWDQPALVADQICNWINLYRVKR